MLLLCFCTLMNDVLRPYLDSFVVAYLDDIVVFSDNMEDHENKYNTHPTRSTPNPLK